jgi:hypothetical protein
MRELLLLSSCLHLQLVCVVIFNVTLPLNLVLCGDWF